MSSIASLISQLEVLQELKGPQAVVDLFHEVDSPEGQGRKRVSIDLSNVQFKVREKSEISLPK